MSTLALFLDRDGVVNVDTGYAHHPEQIQFVAHIFELVTAATRGGYKVFVITNQAGIGRGYYTEADFHALTAWIADQFALAGGRIERTYFCPHHPEHGVGAYRLACSCRKPAPGMLLQAARDYDIDLARSIFVGDKRSDMEAGWQAGVGTLLYLGDEPDYAPGIKIASPRDVVAHLRTHT
ncbi:D-glycero-D-manno-heptose 1,7-bisphosphate phosphatase [Paraburkholderia caballeronis]|uniref:D-glycero-alpha-D-manno-heptose-1,7-bisphosphate 7-phosphatase n=1 Tax=Paraburkholderia caballeronis TaxID=416943 RepID=UPI001064A83D|nr:HAD family hydrolase [Paraburkholderia caballeronis]TDV34717.1 D-glycero-D-manno-heptose 1,7-bisphosphate phosphatase [Paraburkholderia caballeronis]